MSEGGDGLSAAWIAVAVAAAAAWLNYRKLKLELFEKRYCLYQETVNNSMKYFEAISKELPVAELNPFSREYHLSQKRVKFLFGADVASQGERLSAALKRYLEARADVISPHPDQTRDERIKASSYRATSGADVIEEISRFAVACEPYLQQYSSFWHQPKVFFVRSWVSFRRWQQDMDAAFEEFAEHVRSRGRWP